MTEVVRNWNSEGISPVGGRVIKDVQCNLCLGEFANKVGCEEVRVLLQDSVVIG